MTNKQKFLALASKEATKTLERNNWRIKNREWLKESQEVAFKVLEKLDQLKWSQVDLAKKMEVSPQQIHKIVKGQENLTLVTLKKLQSILDIPVMASYYEDKLKEVSNEVIVVVEKALQNYVASEFTNTFYKSNAVVKMHNYVFTNESTYQKVS
jgi:ribosome-binding protein aMBF1 (putative translation factor)